MRTDIYSALVAELVEAGELKALHTDVYEDMGGHLWHYDTLDETIETYVNSLSRDERSAFADRVYRRVYGQKK